jgi:uncharacterized protein YoxC
MNNTLDSQTFNALVFAFIGVLGGFGTILGAIAIWIQLRAKANNLRIEGQVEKENKRAEADLITTKAQAELLADVAAMAKVGTEALKSVVEVVRDNTIAANASAAGLQGMLAMSQELRDAVRRATIGMDEANGTIAVMSSDVTAIRGVTASIESHQTNLGDNLKDQLSGILIQITKVNASMAELVAEIQNTSGRTNAKLIELIESVKAADKRAMDLLGQFVTDHMPDFLPTDTPPDNGNTINNHELPVSIHIESNPKESTP